MIVSPGRGYVFVHIPKTGGTSLAQALEARALKDDILIGDTPKARRRKARAAALPTRGRLWKHARLADLDGYLGPDELSSYFVFTIVRNPWDRMVSYYHWLRTRQFDHPAVEAAHRLEFEAFLADPTTEAALRNDAATAYVTDRLGTDRCGLYLRFERLDADVARLADRLGVRLRLPVLNASERGRDYRGYYSDVAAEQVARCFERDIRHFGYTF